LPAKELALQLEYGKLVPKLVDDANGTVLEAKASPKLDSLGFQEHLGAFSFIVEPGQAIFPELILVEGLINSFTVLGAKNGAGSSAVPL
jgi:hypothetical protein